MVIWINGPFGVGKTTLSKALLKQVKPGFLFDPEYIGFLMKGSHDFQDIQLWRTITGALTIFLARRLDLRVVIPMTITSPAYLEEIFKHVSNRGIPIHHFYLELNEAKLRQRIDDDKRRLGTQRVQKWRFSQLERCLNSRNSMPRKTIFLSAEKTTQELVSEIQSHL